MKRETTTFQVVMRWVASLVILVVGVSAMLALGSRKQEKKPPDDDGLAPVLEAFPVMQHNAPLEIEVDGIVTPFREIEIRAEVAGRIDEKAEACRAGRFVKQGDVLIKIDIERHERELSLIEAQINELDVEIDNAKNLIQLTQEQRLIQERDLKRMQSVQGDDVYSESEIDQVLLAINAADNAIQTVQNRLNLTEAQLARMEIAEEQAADDLKRAFVKAPVDGVIVSDMVELGSHVERGHALFVIEDTAAVEVKCNLEMDQIYWLWSHSDRQPNAGEDEPRGAYELPPVPVTVSYQLAGRADLKFCWNGRLSRYDGIGVDERTRTVPCRLIIDQPRKVDVWRDGAIVSGGEAVRPPALVRGMYVKVAIQAEPSTAFVKVPENAVRPDKRVWCIRDGKLNISRPLTLVQIITEDTEDEEALRYWLVPRDGSGLQNGDLLALTPPAGAYPDMPVRVAGNDPEDETPVERFQPAEEPSA
jgi:multidrug efflux pump subunit AcrA (membrane-fusion protein)